MIFVGRESVIKTATPIADLLLTVGYIFVIGLAVCVLLWVVARIVTSAALKSIEQHRSIQNGERKGRPSDEAGP